MKIESSAVLLSAGSTQTSSVTKTEELNVWGNAQNDQDGTDQGVYILSLSGLKSVPENMVQEDTIFSISDKDKAKIELIQRMIELMTGKKMQFYLPDKYMRFSCGNSPDTNQQSSGQRQGWGIDYEMRQNTTETQQMSFSAKVQVKTADGRSISVALDLQLNRSFTSEDSVSFKAGDALKDPLVVNYASDSASFGGRTISFDIDNNGKKESMSFLKNGSGFLVLDKNGDGIVNDGSELFGPTKGNGFLELKAYDKDGNGWIDQNDPVYNKLQIWTKDENGNDELFAVGQLGIGAIYVNGIKSTYDLKDSENKTMGTIQQTGIFLRENGLAGTLQNVDLAV